MSSSAFRIAFEGEAFEDGEIDVKDLAPALLAFGDIVQAANRALNDGRSEASLKIRATRKGSFEALLSVDVSMIEAVRDMLDAVTANPDRIVAADKLLDLLLKGAQVVGVPAVGLIAAVKMLKGRRPDNVEPRDGGAKQITANGTIFVVDGQTARLLEDLPTRKAIEQFGECALGIEGVSAIRIGERARADDLVLTPEDRPSLKVPEPSEGETEVKITDREVWLKIVTLHFRDGYKWRFADGGEKPFTAEMADPVFLQSLQEGKITLSANDMLRCRVREKQILSPQGLAKEQEVVKVIEHIPGARQLRLL